jgi:putative adhesin
MSMKYPALAMAAMILAAGVLSADADGSFDKTVTVSGPVDLDVVTASGGITVLPGRGGSVRVHATLKAQHGWFDFNDAEAHIRELERNPPVEQTGNRIRIGYVHGRDLLRGVSMRLEIYTPVDSQLRAHADSGGIHVQGIRGPADCHTDSGGIEVREVGSEVRASADSGGIHLGHIGGAVTARVDSGGIDAIDIAGGIDAQADSGSIRLAQTKPAPIHAKADSGGITVRLAPGAGYDVSAGSESGSISVPEMTVRSEFSRHHVDGKIRGGGPLVNVRVDSGGIRIE